MKDIIKTILKECKTNEDFLKKYNSYTSPWLNFNIGELFSKFYFDTKNVNISTKIYNKTMRLSYENEFFNWIQSTYGEKK